MPENWTLDLLETTRDWAVGVLTAAGCPPESAIISHCVPRGDPTCCSPALSVYLDTFAYPDPTQPQLEYGRCAALPPRFRVWVEVRRKWCANLSPDGVPTPELVQSETEALYLDCFDAMVRAGIQAACRPGDILPDCPAAYCESTIAFLPPELICPEGGCAGWRIGFDVPYGATARHA